MYHSSVESMRLDSQPTTKANLSSYFKESRLIALDFVGWRQHVWQKMCKISFNYLGVLTFEHCKKAKQNTTNIGQNCESR